MGCKDELVLKVDSHFIVVVVEAVLAKVEVSIDYLRLYYLTRT